MKLEQQSASRGVAGGESLTLYKHVAMIKRMLYIIRKKVHYFIDRYIFVFKKFPMRQMKVKANGI